MAKSSSCQSFPRPLAREAVAQNRPDNLCGCEKAAANAAGNFGLPSATPAMARRNLQDAEAVLRRLDLHLSGPAEIGVAHSNAVEGIAADGAKGAEVCEARPIEYAHQKCCQQVAELLLRSERAGLTLAQHARAEHEIRLAALDRGDQARQLGGVVAAVGVHEGNDVRLRSDGRNPGQTRLPIAAIAAVGPQADIIAFMDADGSD